MRALCLREARQDIYAIARRAREQGKSTPLRWRKSPKVIAYVVPAPIVDDMLEGSAATRKAAAERLLASIGEVKIAKDPAAYRVPADIVNDMIDGSASTRKAAAERLLAFLEED